ncbi:hypothetical protein EXIGLDRAFT_752972 [Exidia glandulosa HHB12029]|uniref:Fungal N-terminal domain-containing protein n=1 Tax=Exidia glandulosa HHB12029 TaxID=1314781 RepID=A0A165E5E3_EXIGL|nr:hypothetical protein EXIGLDRAFT_752972 [Exidia glandulosa HHB12029]
MPITPLSLGDIVTLLSLALAIRRVLAEASESSAQIRNLVADIDSFTHSLYSVQEVLRDYEHDSERPLPGDIKNGLGHAVSICQETLETLNSRINDYRERLSRPLGARVWQKYWTACAWEILGGKRETEAVKRRLMDQIQVIQTYLALLQAHAQSKRQRERQTMAAALVSELSTRVPIGVPMYFLNREGLAFQPLAAVSFEASIRPSCT